MLVLAVNAGVNLKKAFIIPYQIYFQESLAYTRVCTLICTHTVRTEIYSYASSMIWGQFMGT